MLFTNYYSGGNFFPPILERENALSFVLVCNSKSKMILNVVCKWFTSYNCIKYHNLMKKTWPEQLIKCCFWAVKFAAFFKIPLHFPKNFPSFFEILEGKFSIFWKSVWQPWLRFSSRCEASPTYTVYNSEYRLKFCTLLGPFN